MNLDRYPADWAAISQRVRATAGHRCEWCGVPNGALGWRDPHTGYFTRAECGWPGGAGWQVGSENRVYRPDGSYYTGRIIRIVLTVAHVGAFRGPVVPGQPIPWGDPHDKHDTRPANLVALCQRCHLGYDHLDHVRHAAASRRAKQTAAGQLTIGDLR